MLSWLLTSHWMKVTWLAPSFLHFSLRWSAGGVRLYVRTKWAPATAKHSAWACPMAPEEPWTVSMSPQVLGRPAIPVISVTLSLSTPSNFEG